MVQDKISIIIPCYNEREHIGACIENIMSQSIGREMIEVIVVNDASTDDSWEILLGYEEKYPENLMLINCEENGKLGKARNIGVSYASGNYLLFMDSDDLMVPNAVEKLYQKMKETKVDFVECEHIDFNDDDRDNIESILSGVSKVSDLFDIETVLDEGLYEMPTVEDRKHYMQLWGERSCGWAILFDHNFYETVGMYFPEGIFMEDCFFGELLMTECRRMYHMTDKMYLYYKNVKSGITHGENMKKNYMNKHFSIMMLVVELKKRGTFNEFRFEIGSYYFHQVLLLTTSYMKYAFSEFPMANYIEMKNYMRETFPDYLDAPFIDDDERTLYRAVYGI